MKAMPEIHRIVTNRHEVAREWKARTGGQVLGYLSIDIPEELIYAAGILPVRILGSHEHEVITAPYVWNEVICAFERDCLAQGLQGRYDYLDGIVAELVDPHVHMCFDAWVSQVLPAYSYQFRVPIALSGRGPDTLKYIRGEVVDFKQSLEAWTGKTISDAALDRAIEVYNRTRRLMDQLSAYRQNDPPLISGAEFMEIALAGMLTDKAEFNVLLERIIDEVSKRQVADDGAVRIMLAGGANDHIDLIKAIETMGARVVVDDHDTGGRYYMTEVVPEADRLKALAARIINKPRSALKDLPERTRHRHLLYLAQRYQAQGIFFLIQEKSDTEQFDYPQCKEYLEGNNIPSLMLEISFTNPMEQFRTRVEAFLEMLQVRGE